MFSTALQQHPPHELLLPTSTPSRPPNITLLLRIRLPSPLLHLPPPHPSRLPLNRNFHPRPPPRAHPPSLPSTHPPPPLPIPAIHLPNRPPHHRNPRPHLRPQRPRHPLRHPRSPLSQRIPRQPPACRHRRPGRRPRTESSFAARIPCERASPRRFDLAYRRAQVGGECDCVYSAERGGPRFEGQGDLVWAGGDGACGGHRAGDGGGREGD